MAYFLAIDGIKGSSLADPATGGDAVDHVGWIELEGFTFSVEGGVVSDINLSVSSDDLVFFLQSLTSAGLGKNMTLHQTLDTVNTQPVVYSIDLSAAKVTAIADSASAGHSVSLSFAAIEVAAFGRNNNGTFFNNGSFGWNSANSTPTTLPATDAALGPAYGGGDTWFMKIDGLAGSSTAEGREGWFELSEFQYDIITGAGGSLEFAPLQVIFADNAALVQLVQAMCEDNTIAGVQIDGVTYDAQDNEHIAQTIVLANVQLAQLIHSGVDADVPKTSIAFDYGAIRIEAFRELIPASASPLSEVFEFDRVTNSPTFVMPTFTAASTENAVRAGTKYYIAIEGLEGNSDDPGYAGWFEINDVTFGMASATNAGLGGASGQPGAAEFAMLSLGIQDGSLLSQALALLGNKTALAGATLISVGPVNNVATTVFKLDLGNITINSIRDDTGPGLNVEIDFESFEIEMPLFNAAGVPQAGPTFGWNQVIDNDTTVASTVPGTGFIIPTGELDYFMKMTDLTGESQDADHRGWFELVDFSLSAFAAQTVSQQPGPTPPAEISNLSIEVLGQAGLLKFLELSSKGLLSDALVIEGETPGPFGGIAYRLRAGDIEVVSIQMAGISDNGVPSYRIDLNIRQIEVSHIDPTTGNFALGSWNLDTNTSAVNIANVDAPVAAGSFERVGTDFFLAISGLRGNSADSGHAGWFDVLEYRVGVEVPRAPNGGPGSPLYTGIEITLEFTPGMGQWLKALATGQVFSGATLQGMMAAPGGPQLASFVDLANLKLTDFNVFGNEGQQRLTLLFSYEKIEFNSVEFNNGTGIPGDTKTFSWDQLNKVVTEDPVAGTVPPVGTDLPMSIPPNFMLIDGFNGGSNTIHHGGWFELEAFDMQAFRPEGLLPEFGNITVNLKDNAELVDVLRAHLLGQTIASIVFDGANTTTGQTFSQIALGNVTVVSINEYEKADGSTGYTITFDYERFTTTQFSPTGIPTRIFGWDISGDSLFNGNINATAQATAQPDILSGTQLDDTMVGLGGADQLYGMRGNDVLDGGGGNDRLVGGLGTDTASYTTGKAVTVNLTIVGQQDTGGSNLDILISIENLIGSNFGDALTGNAGVNVLEGRDGSDTLNGFTGADIMKGGIGNDTYVVDNVGDQVIELVGQGTDTVNTSVSYTLAVGQEIETFRAVGNVASIILTGNAFNNNIDSGSLGDFLLGGAGNDRLRGFDGDDHLTGGTGIDTVTGGTGNDSFVLSNLSVNRDSITDFNVNDDVLVVSKALFGDIFNGSWFLSNATGTAANGGTVDTHFIFDTATRRLYFDSNGTANGGDQLVAEFTNLANITQLDILLIA